MPRRPVGQAIDNFASASGPIICCFRPRSRRLCGRFSDRTFMRNSEKEAAHEEYELQEHERYGAGRRAMTALGRKDVTFSTDNTTST